MKPFEEIDSYADRRNKYIKKRLKELGKSEKDFEADKSLQIKLNDEFNKLN